MTKPEYPDADGELLRLTEEAGFIFRGKVVRHGTTDANLMAASGGKIVTVEIEEILLSTDALRGLAGKEAIVVSEHGAMTEVGTGALFFTNCVVVADHLVVREVGHAASSHEAIRKTARLLNMVGDRPLQRRIAEADLIAIGTVIGCDSAEEQSVPKSEHDPEWWIARVKVQSVLKGGKAGSKVEVLFANSTDIVWYKAPKLREGLSGIFILRHLEAKEAPPEVERSIHQVVDPLDFLPAERLHEVQRLLDQVKEDS